MNAPFTTKRRDRLRPFRKPFGGRMHPPRLASLPVLLVAVFGLATTASAQGAVDDPFAGIEEMVVVGTGAASLFQNQEVSAIAFDSDYLEAIGANDISDVAQFTPNLEIRTPFAASNPTLFIRGVGIRDFNANSSSSVAVYNDEIFMNSPAGQLAQLFDTENIDVLRGPQATTYGRNASAGTIRVISRKPTGTPGATGSITYGRFNEMSYEAAVENVIVDEMLSMRTAGRWNTRDGTTKNRCADVDYAVRPLRPRGDFRDPAVQQQALVFQTNQACFNSFNTDQRPGALGPRWQTGQAAPVKEWVNDVRNWAARTIIRFQHPFLDMDWQLNVHGGQNRGDARQFQHVATSQLESEDFARISRDGDFDEYFDADARIYPGRSAGSFPNITTPFLGNPFEGDYNSVQKEKIDLFGSSLVGRMTFGDYELTSITGYEWNKRDTTLNLDGSPYVGLEPKLRNKAYQVTQELRLDFDDGGGFSWQAGGMFLYEALTIGCGGYASNGGSLVPRAGGSGNATGSVLKLGRACTTRFSINVNLPESNQSYSFFTRYGSAWWNFAWEPAETFSIKGGLRGNYEEKELNLLSQRCDLAIENGNRVCRLIVSVIDRGPDGQIDPRGDPTPDDVLGVFDPPGAQAAARAYGWAGDLLATWSPATDVNFYIRYARGWKGPAINGGIANPGGEGTPNSDLATPVEPEIIDSVELGMKGEFWANRIRLNWALFYYDYQDLQVFQIRNAAGGVPTQELINAGDADILGFEGELDIKPFEGWAHPLLEGLWIRMTMAWLDSKYTDFVITQEIIAGELGEKQTRVTDYTGNRLVNSPELSFIGFVAWPVGGDWGSLVPRVDWSFKDEVFFGPSNDPLAKQDPLWIFNARVTYKSPSETFELSGWIENFTNQAYTVDVFNLSRVRGAILHAIGDPRTYGLTFKVNF